MTVSRMVYQPVPGHPGQVGDIHDLGRCGAKVSRMDTSLSLTDLKSIPNVPLHQVHSCFRLMVRICGSVAVVSVGELSPTPQEHPKPGGDSLRLRGSRTQFVMPRSLHSDMYRQSQGVDVGDFYSSRRCCLLDID